MRIPSLDGLRAISISMVVASHSALCLSITHPEWFEMRLSSLALSTLNLSGRLGVNVFFVISGFLITTLLLKDGHLGRFYFRRTLRIFPPFYAYLIVVLVLVGFGIISVPTTDLIAGFTYTENYFATKDGWYLLHAWSLAVEEQFYLILPAMMLLTKRPLFPLLAMILCPLIRLYYVSHGGPVIEQGFETVADSLAAGCLLAYHRGFPFAWVAPFVALGITLLLNFPGYYSPSIYVALLIPLQNIRSCRYGGLVC
jgi:peptidoglycan/LPS O-acetylase OafA/YrhL